MKKTIISFLLLLSVAAGAFAQAYDVVEAGEEVDFNHSEVYLSAGMPSFLGIFSGIFVAIGQGLAEAANNKNNGGESTEPKKSDPAFTVTAGYNYYFNEHFAIGAFASYEKFSVLNLITTQAKITGQYGWEHFKIYHSASAGILMVPGGGKPSFAFDVTYLGLKVDFKDWNIFVDASIPMTGIIKAGASFKF
jgi:hypothetical protein